MSHNHTILIVQPPPYLPGCVSAQAKAACAVLTRAGHAVHFFNAADDFLEAYGLRADLLSKRAADLAGQGRLSSSVPGEPGGLDNLPNGSALLDTLRAVPFRDPLAVAHALGWIDYALRLISLLFDPMLLDRRGFSHAGLSTLAELNRFVVDRNVNPFADYAIDYCRPATPAGHFDAVLLIVNAPGQLAAAATLARRWQARRPHPAVRLACVTSDRQPLADTLVPPDGPVSALTDEMVAAVQNGVAPVEASAPIYRPLTADAEAGLPESGTDDKGLVLVWQQPETGGTDRAAIGRMLYATSRQGHWNHLVLRRERVASSADPLMRFALDNPNIVHAWSLRSAPATFCCDGIHTIPYETSGYGQTRPMPSLPLWTILKDPAYIQACLVHHDPKALSRMHLLPAVDGPWQPFRVGSQLRYHYLPPDQLPEGHLDEICRMVEAGGSVATQWVRHNLERAFLIAYVEENGIIVGNSSLKYPRHEYIQAVSAQSGIDLSNYLERGYTSVRPAYRGLGIGAKLLEGLTRRTGDYRIFSVIAENNIATQKMAIRNKTRRVATFFSERAQKEMSVWIPEWMLPDGIDLPPQPELE